MDPSVIQAIERWPNVPAVYGWLSLTVRGQWRLHPGGNATEATTGESISNPQILAFINRNYGHDELGRWFFQNGPQRVYVRLDGAPWIVFADDSIGALSTHTGLTIASVTKLWIDELGNLFLLTEHGPGLLIDRDLPRFVQAFKTTDGRPLEDWWAQVHETNTDVCATAWQACADRLPVHRMDSNLSRDVQLGFISNPSAA
ncbi:MAG: DUF2946 family protein [Burkholderiaceae bacterium]|nr:DUF2946 family protein [Burkholderiaceae bacterium]